MAEPISIMMPARPHTSGWKPLLKTAGQNLLHALGVRHNEEKPVDANGVFKVVGNTILDAGPAAASVFLGPAAGALVSTAVQAIKTAEIAHSNNADKKQSVMDQISHMLPGIAAILPPGSKIDPAAVESSVSGLIDTLVSFMKATGQIEPTKSPAPSSGSTGATTFKPLMTASLQNATVIDRGEDGSIDIGLTIHVAP